MSISASAPQIVSLTSSNAQTDGDSFDPVLSPDGAKLLFTSDATNLAPGDANGAHDLFLKDLATGALTLVSTDSAGHIGNAQSDTASFSPDGSKIVFSSLLND